MYLRSRMISIELNNFNGCLQILTYVTIYAESNEVIIFHVVHQRRINSLVRNSTHVEYDFALRICLP